MKQNRVGKSGLVVSAVGLGCNNLGRPGTVTEEFEPAQELISAAIDAGITLFDTADVYGKTPGLSEEFLGRALVGKRDSVVVATKFGMDVGQIDFGARGSRHYIIRAVEASLKRLHTDWIDLYQFHTPDPQTPIEETLSALDDLVRSGKVRYIGHSNRAGWHVAEAAHTAQELGLTSFVSAQNHYNLLDRRAELELIPAALRYGVGVLPYFPLANGLLTGKYTDSTAPAGSRLAAPSKQTILRGANQKQLGTFRDFAGQVGRSPVQVAIGWLAAQPAVPSVIAGATRAKQVFENSTSVDWEPTPEELAGLETIFPVPPKIALF